MKNQFKTVLSLVLVVAMVFSFGGVSVYAADSYDISAMTEAEIADLCVQLAENGEEDALAALVEELSADEAKLAVVEAILDKQYFADPADVPSVIADTAATVTIYREVAEGENTITVDGRLYELIDVDVNESNSPLENAATALNNAGVTGGALILISEGTLTVTNRQDITRSNIIIKGAGEGKTIITGDSATYNAGMNKWGGSVNSEQKALLVISADNAKVMDLTVDAGACGIGALHLSGYADFKPVRLNGTSDSADPADIYLENVTVKGAKARTCVMVGMSSGYAAVTARNVTIDKSGSAAYGSVEVANKYSSFTATSTVIDGTIIGEASGLGAGYYKITVSALANSGTTSDKATSINKNAVATIYTTIPYAIEVYNNGEFADLLMENCTNENVEAGTTVAEAMTADLTTVIDGETTLLYNKNCEEMKALAAEFNTALAALSAETGVDASACLAALDAALAIDVWHNVDADGTCTTCGVTGLEVPTEPITAPNASVSILTPLTLTEAEHDYMVWPSGDATIDRPLQMVMNFKANETEEEAAKGPFADFKCDFYLTFTGLATGSIVADGCYLAGNYGSFGWIVIPADGLELENGVEYPVMAAYDANLKYAQDICGRVKDFTAAIYVAPAILEVNPDFTVSLALKMTDPEDASNVITVGEPAVFSAKALGLSADIPEVEDDGLENEANETVIEEARKELVELGAAAEEVAAAVPTINITIVETPDEEGKIVYNVAPTLTAGGKSVKISSFEEKITFRLPVLSTEAKSIANVYHNDELLGVYAIKEENGQKFVEVSSDTFSEYTVEPIEGELPVAKIGDTEYATLAEAFAAAVDGDTVTLIADVTIADETYTIADGVAVTLDMGGKKITVTDNKSGNFELFYIYGAMTVTGEGTIELTATQNRGWNASSSIFHNRGGVLTVENGTFKHFGGTDMAYVIDNSGNWYGDATTTINNGTLDSTYIAIRNRMEENSHGYSGTPTLNIYGGSITATKRAIWAQASSVNADYPATGVINVYGGEIGLIDTPRNKDAVSMTTVYGGTVEAFYGEAGELTVKNDAQIGNVTICDANGDEVDFIVDDNGVYVAVPEMIEIEGTTMTLGAKLSLDFAIDTAKLTGTDNYAVITVNFADGREAMTVTVPQSEWNHYQGTIYTACCKLAAKQMNDSVSVTFYNADGEAITNEHVDSIAAYAYRALASEETVSDEKTRTLYVDMLNYGSAAQTYFVYDAENLANAALTAEQQGWATASVATTNNQVKGTGYVGSTLGLEEEIRLNFVFDNGVVGEDYSGLYAVATYTDHYGHDKEIRIEGADFFEYGSTMCRISIVDMSVADYQALVSCTVYNADGVAIANAVDSVESYANRATGTTGDTVDAIIKFGASAYAYFAK